MRVFHGKGGWIALRRDIVATWLLSFVWATSKQRRPNKNALIIRVLPVIDGVCNVVGSQLIMCFTTNFCGILPLAFVVFYH